MGGTVPGVDVRRAPECPREGELLEALHTSAWPDCSPRALRDHVAACASCAELEGLVVSLLDEHHAVVARASVPPSGAVWWRAQMRARQEAARAAARPISIAQAIGFACALGILAGGLSLLSPMLSEWSGWMASLAVPTLQLPDVAWSDVPWLAPVTMAMLLALMMVLVLTPVAVYLAVRGD
jgi:hypothetical protein